MPFSMSASLFGARFTMRVGRARASRMARTRYTTLATQSVLRNQAYSRSKSSSSSSGMFLLHLSMLSLLPLLFDSAHGQSAYGYARGASTTTTTSSSGEGSDSKGKAREIHTSSSHPAPSAEQASSISCSSSAMENHPSTPPIIVYHPHTPPYASSSSSSKPVYLKSTSYRHLISHAIDSGRSPAAYTPEPTANAEVRSSTSSAAQHNPPSLPRNNNNDDDSEFPPQHSEPEGFRIRSMIYKALARVPLKSQLSNLTVDAMRDLPVPKVCELIHSTIISDIQKGNGPFQTIHRSTITTLLSLADHSLSDETQSILETANIWTSHLDVLALLGDEGVLMSGGQSHTSRTRKAPSLYIDIIAEQVFEIIHTIIEYNWLEQERGSIADPFSVTPTSSDLASYISLKVLKDPHKAAIAWLSRFTLQKATLDRAEIDCLLAEVSPEFNEIIWPMIHSFLSIEHFRSNVDVSNYSKAVQAYELLLEYTKIHFPSKRYIYDILLKMLTDCPLPPRQVVNSRIDQAEVNASIQRHEELFKTSHKFLLETLQGVLNRESALKGHDQHHRISFIDGVWTLVKSSSVSEPEITDSSIVSAPALKTIFWDLQSLTFLLKYAYRHLRSVEIGEVLYSRRIEPTLARKRDRLPEEQVDIAPVLDDDDRAQLIRNGVEKYVKAHQIADAIRIREATLLGDNELVERVIEQSIDRIASDSGWSEYAPPEKPRRMTQADAQQFEDYSVLHRKQWQIDVLLRCVDVDNMLLTAMISYWTATSQTTLSRYFMHYFFQMVRQVREVRSGSPSDNASSNEGRKSIRFVYKDLDSLPPAGLEMDILEAIERVDTVTGSPDVLVNLLNAARKMGNLSLAEKCWLVLCEEEDRRKQDLSKPKKSRRRRKSHLVPEWTIPTAAYTIMLEVYASEAASDRLAAAEERDRNPPKINVIQEPDLTKVKRTTRRRILRRRSRITATQRSKGETSLQRACFNFASSIYHRFAENRTLGHTDARFFNAALAMFGGNTPEAFEARLIDRLQRALHARDPQEASTDPKDDAACLESEVAAVKPRPDTDLASGADLVESVESDADSTGSKSDSGFGSDNEDKQNLAGKDSRSYPFLEIVLQDIKAAGHKSPKWAQVYFNADRAGIIPASTAVDVDIHKTFSRTASPLAQWVSKPEESESSFAKSRMSVRYDRGQSGMRKRLALD